MSQTDLIDRKDFKKFQNRFSLAPINLSKPQSFVDVVNQAIPFYKQIDELLKREVDFSNKKDVEIITRLLTSQDHSKKDIQVLKKAFGELKFFKETQQNLPANDYTALIKELRCEKFEKFETVFSYDDFGYKYYIILKGSVNVLIPNPEMLKKDKQQNQVDKKQQQNDSQQQPNSGKNNDKTQTLRKQSVVLQKKTPEQQNHVQIIEPPSPVKRMSIDRRRSLMKQQLSIVVGASQPQQHEEDIKPVKKNSSQLIHDFFDKGDKNGNQNEDGLTIQQINALSLLKSKSLSPEKLNRRSTLNPNMVSGIKKLQMLLLKKDNTIEEEENEPEKCEQMSEQQIQNTIMQQHLGFDIIKTLKVGDAFGEIALMNNARRTASIVCKEDTIMVTLSKQSYDKILANYHQKKFMESVNFLKEFSFFSHWQNSKINALYQSMETRPVQYKEVIYKEGDSADFVYFIKEGEFEVTKILKIDGGESPMQNQLNVLMKSGKQGEQRTVKMSVLGGGSSFGEEEIVMGIKRTCRVACISSTAYLYILSKQNRVQWRENLQDKLIETEKIFRERNSFLRPEPFNINDFKIRQSEQIHLESDSEDESNITATSPLHKKRSFLQTPQPSHSPLNPQIQKKLSILMQRGSQIFHQHPIEQIISLKEENARTLKSSLKSFTHLTSSPKNSQNEPQEKANNIPLIKFKSTLEGTNKASFTADNSPMMKQSTSNLQKLTNAQGQRISHNGHFVSSLTDLELDFTKLTIQQTKSPQIKNLIDPFYDPPAKSNISNFKQNATLTKFSPKKGYTQTKFINNNKSLPFLNEKITQQLSTEPDQPQQLYQLNKKPIKIPKEWQNLLKYTTQMSNVRDKESLWNINNFQFAKGQNPKEGLDNDTNMIRVNSLRYSRAGSNATTQDAQVSTFQSPRNSENSHLQPPISIGRSSTNLNSFTNNNYSLTVNSFSNFNSNNKQLNNLKMNSIILDVNKSFHKEEEDFSPFSSPLNTNINRNISLQHALQTQLHSKFQSKSQMYSKIPSQINSSCPQIEQLISQSNINTPSPSSNKMKRNLGSLLITQSSTNSPMSQNSPLSSTFKDTKHKSLLFKSSQFNQISGGGFKNETPKKTDTFRIKVGNFGPVITNSQKNIQNKSQERKDEPLTQSLRVSIIPFN